MVFFNLLLTFLSIYTFSFLYYFSFNENVLLIAFLGVFLYIVQKGLSTTIASILDGSSLELYLTYKALISSSIVQLLNTRSKLELFLDTKESLLSTLGAFVNCHLTIALFIEQFNELFYKHMFQLNLVNLFMFQRFFVKQKTLELVSNDFSEIEFES